MQSKSASSAFSQKVIALILMGTAVFGWLISLSGLILLWTSYRPVRQTAMDILEATSGALEVSSQTIVLLENTLIQALGCCIYFHHHQKETKR